MYRLDLKEIAKAYDDVFQNWQAIDDELENLKIGRRDTPFDQTLMDNMLSAWDYIDFFMKNKDYDLLSARGGPHMLEINHRVHYGLNKKLRHEYKKALVATTEKFATQVKPIREYYRVHTKRKTSPNKIAANIYISILGMPQLFIEGNHRSGSVIASWINLINHNPPFVLTRENAIAFFRPAQEIKKFNKRSAWRSMTKLPKYKKDFKIFWIDHCSMRFVKK